MVCTRFLILFLNTYNNQIIIHKGKYDAIVIYTKLFVSFYFCEINSKENETG